MMKIFSQIKRLDLVPQRVRVPKHPCLVEGSKSCHLLVIGAGAMNSVHVLSFGVSASYAHLQDITP